VIAGTPICSSAENNFDERLFLCAQGHGTPCLLHERIAISKISGDATFLSISTDIFYMTPYIYIPSWPTALLPSLRESAIARNPSNPR